MNAQRSTFNIQRPTSLGLTLAIIVAAAAWLPLAAFAQTNLTRTGSVQTKGTLSDSTATNAPASRLPALSDFQRLQYYYAAQSKSPAPGTEHNIFTLKPDRTWSGDWNSKAVPAPTRKQLDAITPPQVDLFHRAGVYTNGAWQIVTSRTTIALVDLTMTPSDYARMRAIVDRDKAEKELQRAEQALDKALQVQPAASSPATK